MNNVRTTSLISRHVYKPLLWVAFASACPSQRRQLPRGLSKIAAFRRQPVQAEPAVVLHSRVPARGERVDRADCADGRSEKRPHCGQPEDRASAYSSKTLFASSVILYRNVRDLDGFAPEFALAPLSFSALAGRLHPVVQSRPAPRWSGHQWSSIPVSSSNRVAAVLFSRHRKSSVSRASRSTLPLPGRP